MNLTEIARIVFDDNYERFASYKFELHTDNNGDIEQIIEAKNGVTIMQKESYHDEHSDVEYDNWNVDWISVKLLGEKTEKELKFENEVQITIKLFRFKSLLESAIKKYELQNEENFIEYKREGKKKCHTF
jgi:hypothetical protein